MNTSLSPQNPSDSRLGRAAKAAGVYYDPTAELLRFTESSHDPHLAAARMTLRDKDAGATSRAAMESIRAQLPTDAARKMAAYQADLPARQVAVIREFVENAVAVALPQNSYSVETLMRPCMAFVYWAVFVVGCPQDATVVFDRELVEQYIHTTQRRSDGTALADGTLRNYRAWILRVAEAVNPEQNPRNPRPLNGRGMDEPYDDDEHVALDRWASGQNTAYMRQGARTLIALGAGGGLSATEITHLRRESVTIEDNGSITIDIPSEKVARQVVLVAKYETRLAKALKQVPPGAFVFFPNRTRTENDVVSSFVGRSVTPPGSPTVRAQRLRNTWLVTHMRNRVDVYTLMQASGLKSLESISRLAIYVPRPSNEARAAQLRGTR